MKKLINTSLIAVLVMGITYCTPDHARDLKFSNEFVKISGVFSSNNRVLALGDTLQFNITLPDTVASTSNRVSVNSLQECFFNMYVMKIDTVNRKGTFLVPPIYWVSRGYSKPTGSIVYYFDTRTKPYRLTVNIRPLEKGIYLFSVASPPGELRINNGFAANLLVDFDVPSRNIDLARPYLDDAWVNDALTRPQGTYVFKVE